MSTPKVTLLAVIVEIKGGEKVRLELPFMVKNPTVRLPEGAEYRTIFEVRVDSGNVTGLRGILTIKRAGIKVDKIDQRFGNLEPDDQPHLLCFDWGESPSGLVARSGSYNVQSRLICDEDGGVVANVEWSFKLCKG